MGGWSGTGYVNTAGYVYDDGQAFIDIPANFKLETVIGVQISGIGDGNGPIFNYVGTLTYWEVRAQQGSGLTTLSIREWAGDTIPITRASQTGYVASVDKDSIGNSGFRIEVNGDTVSGRWWDASFTTARSSEVSYTVSSRPNKTEETISIRAGADSEFIYYIEAWPTSHTW